MIYIIILFMICNPAPLLATGVGNIAAGDFEKRQDAKHLTGGKNCKGSWTYKFERSLTGDRFLIKAKIFLNRQAGVNDDQAFADKKTAWKTEIEGRWSAVAAFICTKGQPGQEVGKLIPIDVDVEFVAAAAGAHHTVNVFATLDRQSLSRWSLDMAAGTAAHEFGHMMGAFDEYAGAGGWRAPSDINKVACPPTEAATVAGSIMGNVGGSAKENHFAGPQDVMSGLFPECTFTTILGGEFFATSELGIPQEGDYDPAIFEIECPPPGACCNVANNQCTQLSECQCKDLGKGFTYRGDGTPCRSDGTCIPTVSQWGLGVMTLLVLTAATVVIMRRRAAVT